MTLPAPERPAFPLTRPDVLYLVHGYPPRNQGGTENYTRYIAEAVARDLQVAVLATEDEVGRMTVERLGPVTVYRVPYAWSRRYGERTRHTGYRRFIADFLRIVRPRTVHVMHLFTFTGGALEALVESGTPFFLHAHDYWLLCPTIQLLDHRRARCGGPSDPQRCLACLAALGDPVAAAGPGGKVADLIAGEGVSRWLFPLLAGTPEGSHPPLAYLRGGLAQMRLPYLRGLARHAGKIFVPSRYVLGMFAAHGYPEQGLTLVEEGVARPGKTPPVSNREVRFGYLGNITRNKGIEDLIAAFQAVPASLPASLILAGRVMEGMETTVDCACAADSRIRLAGRYDHDRLAETLGEMDVVIVPSTWDEAFNIVAREAVLGGRIVIAADVGALTGFVREGENGYRFPPGDAGALARIMTMLARDPERGAVMSGRLPEFLAAHPVATIEENAAAFIDDYRQTMLPAVPTPLTESALAPLAEAVPPPPRLDMEGEGDAGAVMADARRFGKRFTLLPEERFEAALTRARNVVIPHLVPDEMMMTAARRVRDRAPDAGIHALTRRPDRIDPALFDGTIPYDGEGAFGWERLDANARAALAVFEDAAFVIPLNAGTMPRFGGYRRTVAVGHRTCKGEVFGLLPDGTAGRYEPEGRGQELWHGLASLLAPVRMVPYLMAALVVRLAEEAFSGRRKEETTVP